MQLLNNTSYLSPEFWSDHELKFAGSSKILRDQDFDYDYFFSAPESSRTPLLAVDSITCSTIRQSYPASIMMPEHLTLRLILDGSLIVRYSGQVYLLEKGDMHIFLPGINFEYKTGQENFCKSVLLTISGRALKACISVSRLFSAPVIPLNELQKRKFLQLMERAKSFFREDAPCEPEATAGYCMELIQELESEISAGEPPGEEPLAQILHTLSAEMDKKLTISNIAARFGLSGSGLTRLFREKMQKSFHEYLLTLRMERAKTLLAGEGVSVKEAASLTGFSSRENFSTAFRLYCGVPPGEFGRKYRGRRIVCGSRETLHGTAAETPKKN